MTAAGETEADPLDELKGEWHKLGYCLGRATQGPPLLAFFIRDENPLAHLLEARTIEELDVKLRADWVRRGGPDDV